jgi:putative lipoprotein
VIAQVALALQLSAQPPHSPPQDRWFGADKLKHFFVSAFTQSVAFSGFQLAGVREDRALAAAWAVTATVSIAKEVHDRRSYGLFSYRDLCWDAAGAGVATLVLRRAVERRATSAGDGPDGSSLPSASLLTDVSPAPILPRGALPKFAPRQ